jgi:hypothetical protein
MKVDVDHQALNLQAEALQSECDNVDRHLHEALAELAHTVKAEARPTAPPGSFVWFECE